MNKKKITTFGIILSILFLAFFTMPLNNIQSSPIKENEKIENKFGPYPCIIYCFCKTFLDKYLDFPAIIQIILKPIGQAVSYLLSYIINDLAPSKDVDVYTDCNCGDYNCILCAD